MFSKINKVTIIEYLINEIDCYTVKKFMKNIVINYIKFQNKF